MDLATELLRALERQTGLRLAVEVGAAVAVANVAMVLALCAACLRVRDHRIDAAWDREAWNDEGWGPPVVWSRLGVRFDRSRCIAAQVSHAELLAMLDEIETSAENLTGPLDGEWR